MPEPSRIFRQVVTMEIVALVKPGVKPYIDGEGIVRDAIQENANTPAGVWLVAGEGSATEPEELRS